MTQLWIGTYPEAGAGTPVGLGEGIWSVELDDATGELRAPTLVTKVASPSFLALDAARGVLHAVVEDAAGVLVSFDVASGAPVERSRVASGGRFPCHVVPVHPAVVAVANYGSGTLGVTPVDGEGLAAADAMPFGHAGEGPVTERQEGPHAHFVAVAPGGRHLLVVDLGTDEVRRYALDEGGAVRPEGIAATLPAGTGPRHLGFSADGRTAYVAGELDAQVHVLRWDVASASGTPVQQVPAVVGTGDAGVAFPSHLEVDGDDVLVAVRGADVLTRWSADATGLLVEGTSTALGGSWPRHFAVVGAWVAVALEREHALVVLDRAGDVRHRVRLPSPTCVVPA